MNSSKTKIFVVTLSIVLALVVIISVYKAIDGGKGEQPSVTPTVAVDATTPTPGEDSGDGGEDGDGNGAGDDADGKEEFTGYPVRETATVLGTRLSERYKDCFYVGTCMKTEHLNDPNLVALVLEQFNSLTCENEMKPDALLNQMACMSEGEVKVIFPANTIKLLDWAKANGFAMRGHTLVWHSQTPDWFFREGFKSNGAYVDRETMLARMESYIQQVLEYCNTNYPGMFYAWDVANEVFSDSGDTFRDSPWYRIIGEDFVKYAFTYARQYAEEGTKLFYNDFNCYIPAKQNNIYMMAKSLQAEGLIDGIGMQSHLDISYPTAAQYLDTVERFSNGGFEVQITELDITTDANAAGHEKQAQFYNDIFSKLVIRDMATMINVTSVTVWGVNDGRSWRSSGDPLLFDDSLKPKAAYYSVLQQEE